MPFHNVNNQDTEALTDAVNQDRTTLTDAVNQDKATLTDEGGERGQLVISVEQGLVAKVRLLPPGAVLHVHGSIGMVVVR